MDTKVEDTEEDGPWELKDDFKFAPKKPEGDPWKVLLDPLIYREKIRCEAWINEIQNLLIFAGLFSGLVTAFIIESYTNLQPDPNEDIVSLLTHIARRLDNPLNGTVATESTTIALPSLSFSPTTSAVRINVFWFISLMLSLTVILFGIIAMQWLREHQTYTDQSSKDKIAILNMRVDALERWHVGNIITILPLVVGSSLILFFAGMIDFLLILGNKTVLACVASVIALTLLLLVVSTILPAAQSTLLYIFLRRHSPPSPCPYKSPQSGIFHGVCFYISVFLARRQFKFIGEIGKWSKLLRLNSKNQYALWHLSDTWSKKTWSEVDLCWLSVREACVSPEPEIEGYDDFVYQNKLPPLFDIIPTFRNAISSGTRLTGEALSAAYHCFYELSRPFMTTDDPNWKFHTKRKDFDKTFRIIQQRNVFLQSLLNLRPYGSSHKQSYKPSKGTHRVPPINFGTVDFRPKFNSNISILHHQNIFMFVDHLMGYYSKEFTDHRVELSLRLGSALYSQWHRTEHVRKCSFPPYLRGEIFDYRHWRFSHRRIPVLLFQQYGYMLATFFDGASDPHYQISSDCLLAHGDTVQFLEKAAWDTHRVLTTHSLDKLPTEDRVKVLSTFEMVLGRIASRLTATVQHHQPANPIHLLNFAAIYIRRINSLRLQPDGHTLDPKASERLFEIMGKMSEYRLNNGDFLTEIPDSISRRMRKKDKYGGVRRFSPEWWAFLDGNYDAYCKDNELSPYKRLFQSKTAQQQRQRTSITLTLGAWQGSVESHSTGHEEQDYHNGVTVQPPRLLLNPRKGISALVEASSSFFIAEPLARPSFDSALNSIQDEMMAISIVPPRNHEELEMRPMQSSLSSGQEQITPTQNSTHEPHLSLTTTYGSHLSTEMTHSGPLSSLNNDQETASLILNRGLNVIENQRFQYGLNPDAHDCV